jgi:dolichyl-phosphate beta-glucosyltransferase
VVVPAFNEAERIGRTLRELRAWLHATLPSWEVRVVDDGSSDETARLVTGVGREDPRVVLQRLPHRGKGAAVRAGLLAAAGELRFICDADLAMPVRQLAGFLAAVPSECDVAIGSREGEAARRIGEPFLRHAMGRVFNGIVRLLLLPGMDDTQCGFKLFTARAVETVFPVTTLDGWAFDTEVMVIARLNGLRVKAIPIEWRYGERSRVSPLRDPWRMLADVWRVRRNVSLGLHRDAALRAAAASRLTSRRRAVPSSYRRR